MSLLDAEDVPEPRSFCSTRSTRNPRPAASRASPVDRKSTRLNSSHANISYAVCCLKKKTDTVRITLGPRGRNVVIDKKFGSPTVTKDGFFVAKQIQLKSTLYHYAALFR